MSALLRGQRLRRLLGPSWPLLYVCLLVGLLVGPIWSQAGVPNSADGILHLHRAAAMARSWASGLFWPRWLPDLYQGLGAPTFHYYSPLFYLFVAPLHLAGLRLDLAAKLILTIAYLVSGLATFAWLRRLLSPAAGLVGAALYLAQPHLFRELYFQGDYPQLLALLWLPVVLWAFTRLYQDGRWPSWLIAPASLAVLPLAHHLTTLLSMGMLVFYWLTLLLVQRNRAGWWRGVLAAAVAAGLSAFFWMPALADSGLVQITRAREHFFHYSQYFVPWKDLLSSPPVFDARAANPPFPHHLGWAAWLALAGAIVALVVGALRQPRQRGNQVWAAAGLLCTAIPLALTQPWSTPAWERLPFLQMLQFPGRLLGPAAIGVALAGGTTTAAWGESRSRPLTLALVGAVGFCSSVFLFPQQPFLPIAFPTVEETQVYEREADVWGLTGSNEFLPRWAGPPQPRARAAAQEQFVPAEADWSWETPHHAALQTTAAPLPAGTTVLPVHYFPAWQAEADGAVLPAAPGPGGLIQVDLPQPAEHVTLSWQGTGWQKRGQWVSLGFGVIGLACVGWAARQRATFSPQPLAALRISANHLLLLALLALLILGRAAINYFDLGWCQRTSPPGSVSRTAHPMSLTIGGEAQPAVTLLGWDLLSGSAQPGSLIHLRLYWERGSPEHSGAGQRARIRQDLHSFLQLYTPATQTGWAGIQNQNPGRIPTSGWVAPLYYVDDLVLEVPTDLAPVTYTLAVGLVDDAGQRLTVPGNPDGLILLDSIHLRPLAAGRHHPQASTPTRFGQSFLLQGYDLLADPGGPVLRLYWQTLQPPAADLTVFIHLVDAQGQILAQFDAPPLRGLWPTRQWPEGALLIDRHQLALPESLAGEGYWLLVGLYNPATGQRLPAQPAGKAAPDLVEHALRIALADVQE